MGLPALAITATLAAAAVKPFDCPFKVTEKGGDRTRMRVRGRRLKGTNDGRVTQPTDAWLASQSEHPTDSRSQ
jgi:hypothetical protein